MYTKKNFKDDLFLICQIHYVKFKLLQDYANKKISQQDFVNQILSYKNRDEIDQVLREIDNLQQKIQQNGGSFSEDPVTAARVLRKNGNLQEAYDKIVSYIQQDKHDKDANLTYAWIMYDYLKSSEHDPETYVNNLKKLNDSVQYDFKLDNDEYTTTLLQRILWSLRRVASQGELPANRIFEQFKRLVGNSASFIEKRTGGMLANNTEASPSRSLIKELRSKLNDSNYFALMDMIGFDWFDDSDCATTCFTGKNSEIVEIPPLLETTLNLHAKKLIRSEEHYAVRDRITNFLPILTSAIKSHPDYEWLPYFRMKLLIKLGDNEQALTEVIEFARHRSGYFWVWDLISDLVYEDERFNCLCAGLLCKAKPDLIVKLQEKSVSHLVVRGMYEEAKHILDKLIETRTNNNWMISPELLSMKSSDWYNDSKVAPNIDRLQPFADEAKKILYRTLASVEAVVTHINDEKGIISFVFKTGNVTKSGYLYKDSNDQNFVWKINSPVRIQMVADKKREGLFHVLRVEHGDSESMRGFIVKFSGTFEKVKDFGFIRDSIAEIFVNPTLIQENQIKPFAKVSGSIIKKWDNKRDCWGWQLLKIDRVENSSVSDYEKNFSGKIEIAVKGFGFIEECYVPEDLVRSRGIRTCDIVTVKAQKSWDKRKEHWSWRAIEIM